MDKIVLYNVLVDMLTEVHINPDDEDRILIRYADLINSEFRRNRNNGDW